MKTINVKFVGFWSHFIPENHWLYKILEKHYHIVQTDDPDYIICSICDAHSYVNYPQVRIMFCGENFVPDFNLVDYAISFYPVEFLDRHFSFPGLLENLEFFDDLKNLDRAYPDEILAEKTCFANFIFSHRSESGVRDMLFDLLSEYRRVESAGTYKNNMPDGNRVRCFDGTKRELQKKCKFTICCESTNNGGFITEKLFDAFSTDTVPIYCGSSHVGDIFNKKAFVDVSDFENIHAAVEYIKMLDRDDEKYLQMLREPVFVQTNYLEDRIEKLEEFLCHIFDQPLEKVYRRSMVYAPHDFELCVKSGRAYMNQSNEGLGKWQKLKNIVKTVLYRFTHCLMGE